MIPTDPIGPVGIESPPTGSPGSKRLITDNAWAYRWSLRDLCTQHGITQKLRTTTRLASGTATISSPHCGRAPADLPQGLALARGLRRCGHHDRGGDEDRAPPAPIRIEPVGSDAHDHGGWGAGAGTVERYEYRCPCGDGTILEKHDNIPAFREHHVHIDCGKCRSEWRFVDGRGARDWALEPMSVSAA